MTDEDTREIIEALKIERAKSIEITEMVTKALKDREKEIARLKAQIKELEGNA